MRKMIAFQEYPRNRFKLKSPKQTSNTYRHGKAKIDPEMHSKRSR